MVKKNTSEPLEWNKDLFSEKIINLEMITPKVGDVSGTNRDFEWEKSLKEYEPIKNEAQKWLGKSKKLRTKFMGKRLLKKKSFQYKEPLPSFPNYTFPKGTEPTMYAVGQSHLDIGYRWRYLQTTEKIRITAGKACFHVKNVPKFTFSYSQPIMLEWTLHKDPELFKEIQEAVKTGRFELVGGSYLEPDTHLISGESWVRQRLYGQLFYKKYFNKFAEIEWVPDSFGFTSTIPQFIAKSEGKYFFTKKMNWNDSTCFPFSVFWWKSPDGSKVLTRSLSGSKRKDLLKNFDQFASTSLLLNEGVDGNDHVYNYESEELEGFLENPPSEVFSNEMIPYEVFVFGQSDGGHGPRGVEVQTHLAMDNKGWIKLSTAAEYYKRVETEFGKRLPVWEDELYLEYHRGTLTTSPLLKKMNRYFENLLPSLEKLAVLANIEFDVEIPHNAFIECWKFTLLQQFHDVLPGSNVPELLDDCWAVWDTQLEKSGQISNYLWEQISSQYSTSLPESVSSKLDSVENITQILLFNPNSYTSNVRVEIPIEKLPKSGEISEYVLITNDGIIEKLVELEEIDCGKRFYYSPKRISFSVAKLQSGTLTVAYLIPEKNLKSEILKEINGKDTEFKTDTSKEFIKVSNSLLQLKFDCETAACISLKHNLNGKWKETLAQGKQKYKKSMPELPAGIIPQAYYEYSGVYAAWDLFPNSLHYPHKITSKSVKITSQDSNHITVVCEFELKTPPVDKIQGDKKKVAGGDLADMTGRRDPDVHPIFPDESEYTDISPFSVKYTIYKEDPKLHLEVMCDFNAKDTMVKLNIPTATNATRVSTEVAYGINNRATVPKTSRDKGRWEQLMHSWINLQSQDNTWGLGIINEGKYGFNITRGLVGITLVRGKKFPKPFFNLLRKSWVGYERKKRKKEQGGEVPAYTSQNGHVWNFILYPHAEDVSNSDVLQQAHIFNNPIQYYCSDTNTQSKNTDKAPITLPRAQYPLEISTCKIPHPDSDAVNWFGNAPVDGKVYIIRAVNWSNEEIDSEINMESMGVTEIIECDLLEQKLDSPVETSKDGKNITSIKSHWKKFEVKTYAFRVE